MKRRTIFLTIIAVMLAANTATAWDWPWKKAPSDSVITIQLPRPIGQAEADWWADAADSTGCTRRILDVETLAKSDSVRIDNVEVKVERIPTTAPVYTGSGSNFLRVSGEFAQSWRDSVELDTHAAEKDISREEAAKTEEWKDLQKTFRTADGRRETAEMYLSWLEAGGRAADLLSGSGVQTRAAPAMNLSGLATVQALRDSLEVLRGQIKSLAEAAAKDKVSGEVSALRSEVKEVATRAGSALNPDASKALRKKEANWLYSYGQSR